MKHDFVSMIQIFEGSTNKYNKCFKCILSGLSFYVIWVLFCQSLALIIVHLHNATNSAKRLVGSIHIPIKNIINQGGAFLKWFFFCSYNWIDDDTIIANVIPENRGDPPVRPLAPIGPKIEDNSDGKLSQARTYQDLLKDSHDEDLFDHYCLSELVSIKVSLIFFKSWS